MRRSRSGSYGCGHGSAPILGLLGVQPLVAHFFVFCYGILAEITPPVALAAYAAAGIANANPFRAGTTAFRLGMGGPQAPQSRLKRPEPGSKLRASPWWHHAARLPRRTEEEVT